MKPGVRGDDAHVGGGGLGDDRGDLAGVRGERGAHGVEVVVRQHEGLRGGRRGHAGRAGQREGGQAGAGLGQQPVGVAVVVAGELDQQVAAGEAAGQADRRHRRLGAGRDQAQLLDRRADASA